MPISNPANLVIYGSHVPPLLQWLDVPVPTLSDSGKTAVLGIAATAIVLLVSSAGIQLGLSTAIAGTITALVVLIRERKGPWTLVKDISWGLLPLVAGLFVMVEALGKTGLIEVIGTFLHREAEESAGLATWGAGVIVAFASNLLNNLPAGLTAGNAVRAARAPDQVTRAVLIGVDLGPNLSVTGSLATILWLTALRREEQTIGAATFLKIGSLVMPPALLLAIGAAWLFG